MVKTGESSQAARTFIDFTSESTSALNHERPTEAVSRPLLFAWCFSCCRANR
jgi:hypothetical protein